MLTIPILTSEPHSDQTTNLDGTEYTLSLRYNTREARYYLSIGGTDGTVYASGAALVVGWPLFGFGDWSPDPRLPPGRLLVIANGTDISPPKLGELGPGLRCELVYFDAAERASYGL